MFLLLSGGVSACQGETTGEGSLRFVESRSGEYDYGLMTSLPDGFGDGEFTMELWIKPDASYPVGPTSGRGRNSESDRLNWSDADNEPYSVTSWWFDGNFLLDGFNNRSFAEGSLALQFYGGGRLRWLLGDGASAGPGGVWSIGVYPATGAPSLLDGGWHHVAVVRRWSGLLDAALELWIDGDLVATETSSSRTNLAAAYWDGATDGGWYWGAEKQAAENSLPSYEDYKGLLDEIRFWSVARQPEEIAESAAGTLPGDAQGLVGYYVLDDVRDRTTACNELTGSQCIRFFNMSRGNWQDERPPVIEDGAGTESRGPASSPD